MQPQCTATCAENIPLPMSIECVIVKAMYLALRRTAGRSGRSTLERRTAPHTETTVVSFDTLFSISQKHVRPESKLDCQL